MRETTFGPSRRVFLAAGPTVAVAGGHGLGARSLLRPTFSGDLLAPGEAHDLSASGDLLLVDIRRPEEWAETGIARPARPLDMRRDDFTAALLDMAGGDRRAAIALICAAGVRSARLAERLTDAGFTGIHDVPEGMTGGIYGPGWIARGLPTRPYRS